jgi:omega-6 fatty acid desaturase (delta-12 desaturase)
MIQSASNNMLPNTELWQKIVMKYNRPSLYKSLWQICNSFVPFVVMCFLMYKSLVLPYWITLLLILPASGFLIRLFIIFHDCGHGSFFKSKKANDIIGKIMGIMAFTPYYKWHSQHHTHHSTSGNLDKRGVGDVWTMTVDEYLNSSKGKRFIYRAFRNPFTLFTIGPLLMVFYINRVTSKEMTKKEKHNVYFTNIIIVVISVLLSYFIGLKAYLLILLPLILISHSIGLWLFYIQHQFDEVSWERSENWDYKTAAVKGSSFLKLSPVLQWFTGNIGFHHVHHLSSKIPNYNLSKCHYQTGLFKDVKPIRFFATFKALKLNLWDEANRQLISFKKIAVNGR